MNMPCHSITLLLVTAAPPSRPLLTGSPGWSAALWRCRRQRGFVPAACWWSGHEAAPGAGWAAGGGGRCRARSSAQPGAVQGRDGAVTTPCNIQSCSSPCPVPLRGWMMTDSTWAVLHYCPLPSQHTLTGALHTLCLAGCSPCPAI